MGKLRVAAVPGDPGIFAAVEKVVATLPHDYVVRSWLRPGSTVYGTGSVSLHASGDALDIWPEGYQELEGSPCGGAILDGESMRRNGILAAALRSAKRKNGAPLFDEVLWETCTGGNHYNHVHVGGEVTGSDVAGVGDPVGASAGGGGSLGVLLEATTWIRIAEVVAGTAAIGGAVLLAAREGIGE